MEKITSRIVKHKTSEITDVYGEITFNELKTKNRKRMKQINKQREPNVCKILSEDYQFSPHLSDKKAYGYIQTDEGRYLKIVKSKFNILPFPMMVFILKYLTFFNVAVATAGIAVVATSTIIITQKAIAPATVSETPTATEVPSVDNSNGGNSGDEDDFITDATIGDYNGDELESLESDPTSDYEESYTIIDGIIYQGEYLSINKGTIIPLGNNPENAKTNVSLQFIVKNKDEIIFKTPKLKAGTKVDFIPSEYLGEGIHNLHLIVNVFHENGFQDIGYNQDIKIKIAN